MKNSAVAAIRLELTIRELPEEPMNASSVRETVEAFARSVVSCPKHKSPLGEVRVELTPGVRATVDCAPCCRRTAKELALRLPKLKTVADDRVVSTAPAGHSVHRVHDLEKRAAEGPPKAPFTLTGSGLRAVSSEVASLFAEAGKLQHIVRVNDDDSQVDAYTVESAEAEIRAKGMPDKWPPAFTEANIRKYSQAPIARVMELALKERHPLCDYAIIYDWDTQVVHGHPAKEIRALFAKAGDCPKLIEEIDANRGETLLVFFFYESRYRFTSRVTSRGFVVGSAGRA